MEMYNIAGARWCTGWQKGSIEGHWAEPYEFASYNRNRYDSKQPMCKHCKDASNEYTNSLRCGDDADPDAKATRMAWDAYKRARKLERTPSWLSKEERKQIRLVYKERDRLNKEAGYVKYHVDHVFPLVGDNVSGLHVLNNLEIITAEENLRKNNHYETGI